MESLRKQAARILREKKKYKLWLTAFLCMAVLVTAGTVAALTMNGQALNRKEKLLICGLDVHEHTEQCRDSEGELVCGQADYVIHIHNDDCYGEDGALVCALPERKPHVHDAACLEEQKTLTCTLEETQGHQHDEACYTKVQGELTCGQDGAGHQHGPECYTKVQGEPICGTDGTGHRHGPECYAKVQGELTCASAEEGHEHNEGCYAWSEELTCGLAEEIHEHTDECYAWSEELACGLAEEAHEHTDDCYAWSEELNCEIPEGEDAHAHTEDCYTIEENYICGELELHAHEDGCYDEEGNLICEEIELLEHVHADDCFEIIEPDASGEESVESEELGEEDAASDQAGAESGETEEGSEEDIEDGGKDIEDSDEDGQGEEAQLFRKTYEDAEIRVVAEYDESANIPEEAQLVAERIDAGTEGDVQDAPEADGTDAADATDDSDDGDAQEPQGIEPVVDEQELQTTPDAEDEDAAEAPAEDGGASASSVEVVTEEVSYRLRFLVNREEIRPEGRVAFTVQGLDENGNDTGEAVELVYDVEEGLDAMVVILVRETTVEVQHEFRKEARDGDVRVIAEYDTAANIPEEAELRVRQITAESDAESYAQREAECLEGIDGNAAIDMLFEIGFYVDDAKIESEAPVSIQVQIPDGLAEEGEKIRVIRFGENGAEELDASISSDESGNRNAAFRESSLSTYAVGKAGVRFSVRKECRNDALNIIVIAEYDLDAEIPEDVELKVEAITPESNPKYYAQREAEYLEQVGEGAQMDMLLSIGFYDVDGAEIEPKAPVSITVQLLDDQYEDGEQIKVVHFGSETTEELDASEIRTDEEGNKATSFETDSFSDFGVGPRGGEKFSALESGKGQLVYCSEEKDADIGTKGITTFALGTNARNGEGELLKNGGSYQIYCQNGGQVIALSHKGNTLAAVSVSIDASGDIVVPDGYTQEDFVWEYDYNGYVKTLKYNSGDSTYYLGKFGNEWSTGNDFGAMPLVFSGESTDAVVIRFSDGYGLCYSNGGITAENIANPTTWKFKASEAVRTIKVNYYKNEGSVTAFQEELGDSSEKGTLLGSKQVPVEERDGKELIRIPLTGTVGTGNQEHDIGKLDTGKYEYNGNTYLFYGWSLYSNSNYKPDIKHLVYCGDPDVKINGSTVPTYVTDRVITLDVTGKTEEINLHAIWAAPSNIAGSAGVEYYGTNYTKLNYTVNDKVVGDKEADDARVGRGVMFFIRLDGRIPTEPGKEGQESVLDRANYTEYVFAKDEATGSIKRMPLKYWMHIYGVQNGDAVDNNLAYRPLDADLLRSIQEAQAVGKEIRVADEPVDFMGMEPEEFTRDYYVAWYVCKDGRVTDDYGRPLGDCWHIDGVLLKRTGKWNLVYADDGIEDKDSVIMGAQYAFLEENPDGVEIHNTQVAGGDAYNQIDTPPVKTGYNFLGWNTNPEGDGTWFLTAGENPNSDVNDIINVELITEGENAGMGQVYKNGVAVEGLFATVNANGMLEVKLYPQWGVGTNLLKVTKTDEAGNILKGTKFKLYECALEESDNMLHKGRELTTPNGDAVNEKGILTIHDLKNDTFYCLQETYAVNGFDQRTEIYFKVQKVSNTNVMGIYVKDEHGDDVKAPEWLVTNYEAKNTSGNGGLASIEFKIQDEVKFQNVIFMKADENGKEMSGAKFRLTKKNVESGEYEPVKIKVGETIKDVGEATSGSDGVIGFTGASTLPYGEYKLEETEAPKGYKKVCVYFEINDPLEAEIGHQKGMVVTKVEIEGEEVKNFDSSDYAVTENKISTTVPNENGDRVPATGYQYTLTIKNKPDVQPQSVALRKLDADGGTKQLDGAGFNLYRETKEVLAAIETGSNPPDAYKVNKEMIVSYSDKDSTIGEINPGIYYLIEANAPEDYIPLAKPIKITVTPTDVTAYQLGSNAPIEKDKTTDESTKKVTHVLKIYNSKGITLPETGGPGTVMYTLGGLAVIATSLVYGLSMRRKKEKGGQH